MEVFMKRVMLVFVVLALMVGSAWGKNYEVSKKVDDYTVKIEIDKNPPIVGNNNMSITIKDGSGKNITDAKVKVGYSMPAMSGMPAMSYKADGALQGNEYKAKVDFSMAGSWNVEVQIAQAQKVKKVKLNVDVK
jgi:uncharacterized protein YneF (UPF0154 family)